MSTAHITATDKNNQDVVNNSFLGGAVKGECFQMMQQSSEGRQVVQLTKSQAIQQITIMQMWLNK